MKKNVTKEKVKTYYNTPPEVEEFDEHIRKEIERIASYLGKYEDYIYNNEKELATNFIIEKIEKSIRLLLSIAVLNHREEIIKEKDNSIKMIYNMFIDTMGKLR